MVVVEMSISWDVECWGRHMTKDIFVIHNHNHNNHKRERCVCNARRVAFYTSSMRATWITIFQHTSCSCNLYLYQYCATVLLNLVGPYKYVGPTYKYNVHRERENDSFIHECCKDMYSIYRDKSVSRRMMSYWKIGGKIGCKGTTYDDNWQLGKIY